MNPLQNDQLRRFSFDGFPVRGALVKLDEVWQSILQRNQVAMDVRQILGQATAASVLMTSQIRFSGTLGVQLQSSGTLRLALAQCTDEGKVRALCRVDRAIDDDMLIRDAVLSINMEGHSHQQRYQGIVSVDDGNLPNALARYFAQSEQLPTWLQLVVSEHTVAGLMLQKIPTATKQTSGEADPQEDKDAWNRVLSLAETLKAEELLNLPAEEILRRLFHQEPVRLQSATPLTFECSCSRTRVADMLRNLGEAEIKSVLKEQGTVEVICEYCNEPYRFDALDITELFSSVLPPSETSSHHQ